MTKGGGGGGAVGGGDGAVGGGDGDTGVAVGATSTATNRQLSFIAFRNVRAGLVWVDELFTAREWRGMGVARWLMWHAAEGRRVELQVLSGPEGADARRAYMGMGMHRMTGKETCRTYREVSDSRGRDR